ncbi:hypothetical protein [Elongatibacter sediminis]|uniref:Methyltransferase n=1 Tax=Elongatibacter sediminis TaxID=3119006 RepID=A0AAW9R763_9GAMM
MQAAIWLNTCVMEYYWTMSGIKEATKKMLPDFAVQAVRRLKHLIQSSNRLVGMTSKSEQEFYRRCVKDSADLEGAIADLGCWMGSTTISLAKGLSDGHSEFSRHIYAFDQFIWEEWMTPYKGVVRRNYRVGDSFFEEVQQRLSRWSDNITLTRADLSTYEWTGGAIGILLVDAMKDWSLASSIAKNFYPHLSERSILIHQDFKHYFTPWIHIVQYRLRHCFDLLEDVSGGATVAFRCVKRPTPEELTIATRFEATSEQELCEVFSYSIASVNTSQKSAVAAAHVMYFVHMEQPDAAARQVALYRTENLPETVDFQLAETAVDELLRRNPEPPYANH